MLKGPKITQLVIGAADRTPFPLRHTRLEVKNSFFPGLWRLQKALSIKLEPS